MRDFLGFHVPRRTFLKWSGAAAAGAVGFSELPVSAQDTAQQLGAEDAKPSAEGLTRDAPQIRVLMHESDGKPLDSERAHTLIARDLVNDPLPQPSAIAEGRARIGLGAEPLQLGLRLKVPGFGEVYCYADNDGKGYTKP